MGWVEAAGYYEGVGDACVCTVCVCVRGETAVVIAGEEPCARRTLRLIKGGDRVIIHHGPLERLTPKSLLLINSETFFAD